MALQIHRGGLALLALACIQPLETSQITKYLLKFANLGLFLLVWDRRTSWASLYLDLLINHFFLLKWKLGFTSRICLAASADVERLSSRCHQHNLLFLTLHGGEKCLPRIHEPYTSNNWGWVFKKVVAISCFPNSCERQYFDPIFFNLSLFLELTTADRFKG